MKKLTTNEINTAKNAVPDWQVTEDTLLRTFTFNDFTHAFGFMTKVAIVAQELNHHPDWQNVYNTVYIRLSTHDANGLTTNDFELASRIDRLV